MDTYAARTNSYEPVPPEADFNERHFWLWMTLVPILMVMTIFYAHNMWWKATVHRRAMRKQSDQEVEELASTLVGKLAPSLAVEGYRFHGMRKKNATVSLAFENLGLILKNGSSVLDGVTGKFPAGQMVAIMGPSGAGKTTFMNVLCGKATYGNMTGHVYINGDARPVQELKPVMGFVPQDDVVHENLTVREQLRYSAELRGQFGTKSSRHTAVVDDVLQVMQISHIQESIVGSVESRGISGGQRKRVNIGLELAACPSLLFLDEPTSGLDATSSLMIIGSLKKMTQLGMTIIMVIHQPRYSLFTMFDEVLLLGKGGRTVYLGPSEAAVDYFEELGFPRPPLDNPADWLMDVISGAVENPAQPDHDAHFLFDAWEKHDTSPAVEAETPHDATTSSPSLAIDQITLVQYWHGCMVAYAIAAAMLCSSFPSGRTGRGASGKPVSWLGRKPDEYICKNKDAALEAPAMAAVGKPGELHQKPRHSGRKKGGSFWSTAEDKRVIARMLETEWKKVDVLDRMVLPPAMLQQVLRNCLGATPSDALMDKLVKRLNPQDTESGVRLADFVDFFVSAMDLASNRAPTAADDHADGEVVAFVSKIGQAADQVLAAAYQTSAKDDLHRVTPGWFKQYRVFVHRTSVQFTRNTRRRVIDMALITICATIAAVMHRGATENPANIMVFHLGLALLTTVSCLKTFADRPIFWRESGSGINVFSFYSARLTLDSYDVALQTVLYASVYFLITQPSVSFGHYLGPCIMISVVTSGWGYLLATLIPPSNAVTAGVIIMLVLCGVLGNPTFLANSMDGSVKEVVTSISVVRWSMQMFLISFHAQRGGLRYPLPPENCNSMTLAEQMSMVEQKMEKVGAVKYVEELQNAFKRSFPVAEFDHWGSAIFALALQGAILRLCGYLALRFTNRDKQV